MSNRIERPQFIVPREWEFQDPTFYRNVFWLLYLKCFAGRPRRRRLEVLAIVYEYEDCFFERNGTPFDVEDILEIFAEIDPSKWLLDIEQATDETQSEPAIRPRRLDRVRLVYAACLALEHERSLIEMQLA